MAGEIPAAIVASIAFNGRSSGPIKGLSGFRKPPHSVPDAANAATNAFLAKICTAELQEAAEQLFQQVRSGLSYKRRELSLAVASPTAVLTATDFTVEISYEVDATDPSRYRTTTKLLGLHDLDLARRESFAQIFAGRFDELEFGLAQGVSVEAVIDAIESLDPGNGLRVDYPSDYHDCTISVANVDAVVRCTGASLTMEFPRAGGPAELIQAFAEVRDAFRISQLLIGLVVA